MADRTGRIAEPEREWWQNRLVLWPVGSVAVLLVGGYLVSAVFPTSTMASLATGIAWSLAWLTALVILGGFALSKVQARRA